MEDLKIGQKVKICWCDIDAFPTYEGGYEGTSLDRHLIGNVVAISDDKIIVSYREIYEDDVEMYNYVFIRQDDGSWWTKNDEWLNFDIDEAQG